MLTKEQWEMKNVIYKYTNKVNGKVYIGLTEQTLKRRHTQHVSSSRNEKVSGHNSHFHNAIRKYGIENFELEILMVCEASEELGELERYYIKLYNSLSKNGKGYNLSDGGEGGNPYAGKTEDEMEEIKRKLSEAFTGEKHPMYGKHHSEETKQKINEAKKGKYTGEKHPMYGKHHSEEAKQKMSEANRGKHHSEETKRKLSEAFTGEKNGMFGKRHTEEAKQKNREKHECKKVYCVELNQVFPSIREAARQLDLHKASISRVCKGKQKTTGGHRFKFVD